MPAPMNTLGPIVTGANLVRPRGLRMLASWAKTCTRGPKTVSSPMSIMKAKPGSMMHHGAMYTFRPTRSPAATSDSMSTSPRSRRRTERTFLSLARALATPEVALSATRNGIVALYLVRCRPPSAEFMARRALPRHERGERSAVP